MISRRSTRYGKPASIATTDQESSDIENQLSRLSLKNHDGDDTPTTPTVTRTQPRFCKDIALARMLSVKNQNFQPISQDELLQSPTPRDTMKTPSNPKKKVTRAETSLKKPTIQHLSEKNMVANCTTTYTPVLRSKHSTRIAVAKHVGNVGSTATPSCTPSRLVTLPQRDVRRQPIKKNPITESLHSASFRNAALTARENEFVAIFQHLLSSLTEQTASSIFISGVPGCGKTATINAVIAEMRKLVEQRKCDYVSDFDLVQINGMHYAQPSHVYNRIYEILTGRQISSSFQALREAEKLLFNPDSSSSYYWKRQTTITAGGGEEGEKEEDEEEEKAEAAGQPVHTRRKMLVLMIDEMDALLTKSAKREAARAATQQTGGTYDATTTEVVSKRGNDAVMYTIFDWPQRARSPVVLIAVANTMDIFERFFRTNMLSRQDFRQNFQPYTHTQLAQIVKKRLAGVAQSQSEAITDNVIELISRKVAAKAGDARKVLDVCRRVIEISTGKSKIPIELINKVMRESLDAPQTHEKLATISLYEKLFLRSLTAIFHDTNLEVASLDEIGNRMIILAELDGIYDITDTRLKLISKNLAEMGVIERKNTLQEIHMKISLIEKLEEIEKALKILN